jgi:hypothetical protein
MLAMLTQSGKEKRATVDGSLFCNYLHVPFGFSPGRIMLLFG